MEILSILYSLGVAEPSMEIYKDKERLYEYTMKANTIAVITVGTAVLGLGNIGADASLPVMEGKAILFKSFAGVYAIPLCIKTTDIEKFIETIKLLQSSFGDYIIPSPFDARVLPEVVDAVAKTAMETKVVMKEVNIEDLKNKTYQLSTIDVEMKI